MMMKCVVKVLLLLVMVSVGLAMVIDPEDGEGELWAVLVAGSNSWFNYRHQADVCHSYQILHQHGVPDDHIVVMMYDDIANNRENPTPGVIINRPGGPNVYEGVPKDYVGKDVTPEVFLKVLSGDAEGLRGVGSGKVVNSGPNDRIFVNMVDHGAPGIFAFPTTFLRVSDFTNTIVSMSRNNRFKEMTIYMEACESGSMFKKLPDDIEVYALSASNATESSYACYMDRKVGTFLGDVFSVKWMEDTDREDVTKETLKRQYNIVKQETTTSHVEQWGQASIGQQKVGDFVGTSETENDTFGPFQSYDDPCLKSSIRSPDVPLAILQERLAATHGLTGADYWTQQISDLQTNRTFVRDTLKKIVKIVTGDDAVTEAMLHNNQHEINDYACYDDSTAAFNDLCFNLGQNPYALRVVHTMVNLCEHGYTAEEFTCAARAVCTHNPIVGIN